MVAILSIVTLVSLGIACWFYLKNRRAQVSTPHKPARKTSKKKIKKKIENAILDCLSDAALLVDAQSIILKANQAAHDLLHSKLIGGNINLFLRHPNVIEALEQAIANKDSVECEITNLEGRRTFALRASPYSDGLFVIIRDVTRERDSDKLRVDFVANAGHELRTPLTSILGFIETLQGVAGESPDLRNRFLKIADLEAHRMEQLIDDLLSLSKIELDRYRRPEGEINLPLAIDNAVELVNLSGERDGHIVKDLPKDLPSVVADFSQIVQVLQNLIDNALKYGNREGSVTVSARLIPELPQQAVKREAVEVVVKDQGEGIAPEHLPRLTERFYRVDAARSRSAGGTGLGLAIVKHIIERHHGTLAITSTIGNGTQVKFTLPAAAPATSR